MVAMSLASRSTLRLSEVARHVVIPDGIVDSEWPRIEHRLADMAVVFDRWQTNLGELTLGLTADGKYAATVGGITLSIPRQVGKTFTVGVLLVALCIEFPGLVVLWTAHHGRTTTKTFRSIQSIVKRKRVAPHLAAGGGIRVANGEQEIAFANGSIIMFGAREHGFGRGIDGVDVIVFDEAQILGEKALEDMIATTNQSRHVHGALLFYMGTPPRPEDNGEAFANKRRKALSGRARNMVYVECSADPDADPDDQRQWAVANPSFPHHTPVEAMERMRDNLPSDSSWRLEAYGIWPEIAVVGTVVESDVWVALRADDQAPEDGTAPTALAVDMSHDNVLAIAGCWRNGDGFHGELVALDNVTDTAAAEDWVVERAGRRIPVIIDGQSPAAQMIPNLKTRKVKVNVTNAPDMSKACAGWLTDVNAGRFTHAGQQQLTDALMGASKRKIGDAGGWGWDRRDPSQNIAPLVAVTLARFGALVSKRAEKSGSTYQRT